MPFELALRLIMTLAERLYDAEAKNWIADRLATGAMMFADDDLNPADVKEITDQADAFLRELAGRLAVRPDGAAAN